MKKTFETPEFLHITFATCVITSSSTENPIDSIETGDAGSAMGTDNGGD